MELAEGRRKDHTLDVLTGSTGEWDPENNSGVDDAGSRNSPMTLAADMHTVRQKYFHAREEWGWQSDRNEEKIGVQIYAGMEPIGEHRRTQRGAWRSAARRIIQAHRQKEK